MNVVKFPNREHSDSETPKSVAKPLFLVSRLTLPPPNPPNPLHPSPSALPAHSSTSKVSVNLATSPEYASSQTRLLLIDPSSETLSLVHPSLSFLTFVNKLENIASVSKGIVEDRVVVRVLFWGGGCPALYLSPRNEREGRIILNLLKGGVAGLDGEMERVEDRFRAEKAELCGPDSNKGVKMETYESLTLELGASTISIYESDTSEHPISFWGYEQMGLLSNDTDSKVRLHFDDGKSVVFSIGDKEKKKDFCNLIMGRASLPSLLGGSGERILQNNNNDKGVDLDSIIAEKEYQALADKPFDFSTNAPAPSSKVVNEIDRWSNVSKTVNHIPSPSATAISTFEGPLCTCVKYDGDGSLVVEFEGETNTKNTPTNTPIWKQLYFQVVMEPEEPTDEETKVNNPNVLLPSLHAFSNSHKKKMLFKIPLSNGCVVAGGKFDTMGMTVPKKFPFGFGVATPEGTVVFGSADSKVVSQWTSELTKCLTRDLRHYLTAYDASLLTSHLYSVISKDSCVGVLGDVALQIKVHVSKGSGNNSVEVDVLSGGVGRVVTDIGDDKVRVKGSPKRPKIKRGSAKWGQVKGALGSGQLRTRPKSPRQQRRQQSIEEGDREGDDGSTASGSTVKSQHAPPSHPKRKPSKKPSAMSMKPAPRKLPSPPPTPPRSVKEVEEESTTTDSSVKQLTLDQRINVQLHPAAGGSGVSTGFSTGIPPPPIDVSERISRAETPQTNNKGSTKDDENPSPDEPAKTFYRRLSKGSLSPAKLAEAVKLDEERKKVEGGSKVSLSNWMNMDGVEYFISVTESGKTCDLSWSKNENGTVIGSMSLLKCSFDIIDEPEITLSFEGADVVDDINLEPVERVLEGRDGEEWGEEWIERVEDRIREAKREAKLEAEKEKH